MLDTVPLSWFGTNKEHLRITLPGITLVGFYFREYEEALEQIKKSRALAVGTLSLNTWQGKSTLQIILQDILPI
jgi:hypothetical protein